MAQIQVRDLTFSYEGSADEVLRDVNFHIDTDWKLGLIGRNGKGKTTLLNLFMGRYEHRGSIESGTRFDYFPYRVEEADRGKNAADLIEVWKPGVENWQVLVQMNELKTDPECLYRPFETLSYGERMRVMLAVLFAADNEFLLIDEPTNHLDTAARGIVKEYLASKKGFVLVSHDRDLLDAVCDHVLVLNRATIEVQAGNFSSWWENKERADAFHRAENEKHLKEIGKLKSAADRSSRWAEKNENTKIGFDPVKEPERNISTRSYIGAKTKKMQARVKSYETRIGREIEEKEGLLKDIERVDDLKIRPLTYHKDVLVRANDLTLRYADSGHAETVRVEYDDAVLSTAQIVTYYFMVIDPISVNRQGGDTGIQYRTGIYYTDEALLPAIREVYDTKERELGQKLAVELLPLQNFYNAEEYHQKYLDKNPGGYCHIPAAMFRLGQ